jgi:predicted DNA binding CopG/RHH family protein
MNSSPFYIKLALATVCLALSLLVIIQGQAYSNSQKTSQGQNDSASAPVETGGGSAALLSALQKNEADYERALKDFEEEKADIQSEMQKKQAQISRGTQLEQVYSNMIKDVASLAYDPATGAVRNQKLKDLLARHEITVSVDPKTAPAK